MSITQNPAHAESLVATPAASQPAEKPIAMHPSWLLALEDEFTKPYMQNLRSFLQAEKQAGKTIFPPNHLVFNALNMTSFDEVKVVILGQDPYHGPGQAHGLSFSVPAGVPKPPSLVNIFKEISRDFSTPIPESGCLEGWATQGVLLLNTVLTVEAGQAASHQKKGWEQFTDMAIRKLSQRRENLVFMLWGSHAQNKANLVDSTRHLVLAAPHPSPLSAYRGFLGCGHFSQANAYLRQTGQAPVRWA